MRDHGAPDIDDQNAIDSLANKVIEFDTKLSEIGIDTTIPANQLLIAHLAVLAQWENENEDINT